MAVMRTHSVRRIAIDRIQPPAIADQRAGRLDEVALPTDSSMLFTSDLLGRAFWATLLLTGQVIHAEAAVLEAICRSEPDPASDETFIVRAVTAAISEITESVEDYNAALSILPLELQQVLRLPSVLRHCFVLRTLVGFTEGDCARLLHLTVGQVDEALFEAVQQLVRISRNSDRL